MDKYKAIELAYRHHSEYIKMAKAIANNNYNVRNFAEDYVQEAYMRLLRYDDLYDKLITKKGKVSKGYVFFTLRSIIVNDIKKKSSPKWAFLGDQYDFEEKHSHIDEGRDRVDTTMDLLEVKMLKILKERVQWFDYQLFTTYLKRRKSFKIIAAESGIGVRTIYLSIKKSKLTIAEALYEDYQDFTNGDFSLIKS